MLQQMSASEGTNIDIACSILISCFSYGSLRFAAFHVKHRSNGFGACGFSADNVGNGSWWEKAIIPVFKCLVSFQSDLSVSVPSVTLRLHACSIVHVPSLTFPFMSNVLVLDVMHVVMALLVTVLGKRKVSCLYLSFLSSYFLFHFHFCLLYQRISTSTRAY